MDEYADVSHAEISRMSLVMEQDEPGDPIHVRLLSARRESVRLGGGSDLIE